MPQPASAASPRVARPRSPRAKGGLSALEREVIGYFAPWGEVLGVAPSVAQIYGLLYAAAAPLPFDEIREKLGMSQGSVSQGLKFLRERELVTVDRAPDERRERYAAVPSLGRFVQAQLKGEVLPRLESGHEKLDRLRAMVPAGSPGAERVERLAGWNRRGRELLPMLLNLMGG
jgi:DNA-binding transcriptional regulator GbsR (MarR family)